MMCICNWCHPKASFDPSNGYFDGVCSLFWADLTSSLFRQCLNHVVPPSSSSDAPTIDKTSTGAQRASKCDEVASSVTFPVERNVMHCTSVCTYRESAMQCPLETSVPHIRQLPCVFIQV